MQRVTISRPARRRVLFSATAMICFKFDASRLIDRSKKGFRRSYEAATQNTSERTADRSLVSDRLCWSFVFLILQQRSHPRVIVISQITVADNNNRRRRD